MVSHVVLLKPRADLSQAERAGLVEAFEQAIRNIPTVRSVRVGTRVRHGAGYEVTSPDSADYIATIDFDDLEGLQMYLRHPAHVPIAQLFGKTLSSALVYDFEMSDGSESPSAFHVPRSAWTTG
jgi:Stress responsive A/B Barrel Domain